MSAPRRPGTGDDRFVSWAYGPYHRVGKGKRTLCMHSVPKGAIYLTWSTPSGRCADCENLYMDGVLLGMVRPYPGDLLEFLRERKDARERRRS